MEVISTVASVISCLCAPNCLHGSLAQQCNYLRKHQEKSEQLKNRMEELMDQENHIMRKLDLAKMQEGKEPKAKVARWLRKVEKIKNEVDSLIMKVGEEKQCLNGCFLNCHSSLKLGKRIEKKSKMVNELLDHGQFTDDQLTDLQQEKGKPLPTTTLVGQTTAEKCFEKIWKHIMDDRIGKIGVYGMGGVGKTTIMQHIHNRLLEGSPHFDNVIWITVSKDSSIEKLQNDIGKKLDLDLRDHEDKMSRASKLLEALERRKKFIIILDDMWEAFPLVNVGIPNPTRENGCKLLLTTRLRGVCRVMETQTNVKVSVLSRDEAWDLFKEKVGEDVLRSTYIQLLAKDVARECDGLPLALITVGRALRQVDDVMEWKNALNELKASVADIGGLEDEVFKSLRFSYARLKDDKIQACFLYCALYREDDEIEVEELIEHWIGEGLINDTLSREEVICKSKTILNELKYACMVENAYGYWRNTIERVKMHDLIRDLAIRIQSHTCIIKAGFGLTKAPRNEEWTEEVERVSLMGNRLEHLSGKPKCPKLSSLFLQHNPLRDISPLFFQHMYNLRVVNLSDTDIEFLPKSLLDLENLRALLLSNCKKLNKLPSLVNLKSLRTLDLSKSPVRELPPGMEMLVNLRRLDLWGCKLKMFPSKLLQKLTLLEELSVYGESFRWGSDAGGARAEELISATHLRKLDIHFHKCENFHSYIRSGHWRHLTRFTLFDFVAEDKPSEFGRNYIYIHLDNFTEGGTCLMLPDTTHKLDISECDITRLSMCLSNSAQLKKCELRYCNDMECIMTAGENNLPFLERMELYNLPKLSCLCKGVVAGGTLSSLKFLEVKKCYKLKNLFPHGLLQHLQSLEEIKVVKCYEMEEIIGGQGEDDDQETTGGEEIVEVVDGSNSIITLPRLQSLRLVRLPELKSICSGVMVCNSLHTIKVEGCYMLKKLPIISMENNGETLAPPALRKSFIGINKWWDPLTFDHPDTQTFVQPFYNSSPDSPLSPHQLPYSSARRPFPFHQPAR